MTELRVIIAGSRDFNNYHDLKRICDHILPKTPLLDTKITIISGTARGADTLGEQYALAQGYELVRMPADWSLGKKAGYIRNGQMANYAKKGDKGVLIAFWDGKSLGTGHMIDLAKYADLYVYVVNYITHEITIENIPQKELCPDKEIDKDC